MMVGGKIKVVFGVVKGEYFVDDKVGVCKEVIYFVIKLGF